MSYSAQEKRILNAALSVIVKYSISGTRMHLIADAAGMSPANLHYHFKTKRELLLALLADMQETFNAKRSTVIAQRGQTLHDLIGGFFEQKKELILAFPQYDQAQFDFWVLGQSDAEINQQFRYTFDEWRNHLSESILKCEPRLNRDYTDMLSHTMVSLMMGASMQYHNGDNLDLDAYFALNLEFIMGSISKHLPT